ncbi:MAG: hypothetical protein KDD47_20225, partial [Acidobacteria bacterium]|nr:hypothetical protein [Acidobacteriota bacterium]
GVDLVAWARPHLAFAFGGEVFLVPTLDPGDDLPPLEVGQEVRFLSLITGKDEDEILGLTGSDSRRLIAFRYEPGGAWSVAPEREAWPRESWTQLLDNFPADVAFLASESQRGPGWPDLLVVFQDGELARFRCVEKGALRRIWQELWHRLGLAGAEQRLAAAPGLLGRVPDRLELRRAIRFGVVESILQEVEDIDARKRQVWTKGVVGLFDPTEARRALAAGLHPLLQAFRRWRKAGSAGPGPATGDFVTEILAQIYRRYKYANVDIQVQMDRVLRSLDWSKHGSESEDPRILSLAEKCRHNRSDLWRELQPVKPGKNLRDFVYRGGFALERWSSAYLPSDTLRLNRFHSKPGAVGLAYLGHSPADAQWSSHLVVATKSHLQIHRLKAGGTKMELDPVQESRPEGGSLRSLATIPGEGGDRLLVSDAAGTLRLMEVQAETGDLAEVARLELGDYGLPGALASLSSGPGEVLVALAFVRGVRSSLALCRVREKMLTLQQVIHLELLRVSSLDVATQGKNFLFLVASASGGPVLLYSLPAGSEEVRLVGSYRLSSGGVLSVCFDSARSPRYFAGGDRLGLLWCFDLQVATPSAVTCLAWLHQLRGTIPSLVRVRLEDEPKQTYFLAGSDHGELALLGSSDGKRHWDHRMLSPVQRLLPFAGGRGFVVG